MKRRRSVFPLLAVLSILFVICLLVTAALFAYLQLPRMAEAEFGPPSPALSPYQRLIYSARLLLARDRLALPVDAAANPVDFQIEVGDSVDLIAARLEREGLIRDAAAFRLYLIYAGLDTSVQAGQYRLSPALNAVQIARALQDATPTEVSFSILPGWRAEEIAAALPTSGLKVTGDEFLALVRDPSTVTLPDGWPELTSLEGFLYPDVYRLKRDITAQEMVEIFLKRFDEKVTPDLRQALESEGYDLLQAVTLASMVQREAVVADEQPMIASVFLNRIESGMKLDSDPTVQYALGYDEAKKTWWKNPLSLNDLQTDSAYNTYNQPGLPPGPICNPTLSALEAVAHPARTPYYYFRARCDGSGRHAFARTFEEHQQNACQ